MTPINIRQTLHQHPGISGDEHYAHDLIVKEITTCHPDELHTHVGGFGVVAIWGTNFSNPSIAIRCDIDALPIGHRCGHDGHTAILLQVAKELAQHEPYHKRNIIFIFQPEEETGAGAQKIIDSGILQPYNIQTIFGFHNLPGFPLGTAVLNYHTFAAASTGIIYRLEGRSTHASTPEKGINPGLAVAEIIKEFDRLNSSPDKIGDDFRQCTLICVHLGDETFGTSAGAAEVMYTLRAFSNTTMHQLIAETNNIVALAAARRGLKISSTLRDTFRATQNTSFLVEKLEEAFEQGGIPYRHNLIPFRWSEDFSNYLTVFPGAMFGIGSGESQPELHHPDYVFPDSLITPAANTVMAVIDHFCKNISTD